MKDLELIIITGLSGAGKSEAIKCFEDIGYFCIDNLPQSLIMKMAELCLLPGSRINKVALGIDVRGRESFDTLFGVLKELRAEGVDYQILFLEASDEELIKRFKETRRRHPLSLGGQIIDGIQKERATLEGLRGQADMVIDTTNIEAYELRDKIRSSFLGKEKKKSILITVISFGYKYGIPLDTDLVFDVRFLPNPHYIDELRSHTGKEKVVKDFILKRKETKVFMKKFFSLLAFLIPHYVTEGKTHLVIALGCTGGTHRSVTLTEETKKFLEEKDFSVTLKHRDIGRDLGSE